MKYVLIVLFTFMTPENEVDKTFFQIEMSSRQACLEAAQNTKREVEEKYPNALALSVECRPQTPWDEPISMTDFRQRDVFANE